MSVCSMCDGSGWVTVPDVSMFATLRPCSSCRPLRDNPAAVTTAPLARSGTLVVDDVSVGALNGCVTLYLGGDGMMVSASLSVAAAEKLIDHVRLYLDTLRIAAERRAAEGRRP